MITINIGWRRNQLTNAIELIDRNSGTTLFTENTLATATFEYDPVELAQAIEEFCDSIDLEQESDLYDMDIALPGPAASFGPTVEILRSPTAKVFYLGEPHKLELMPGQYHIDLTSEDGSEIIGFTGPDLAKIRQDISTEAYDNNWILRIPE